MQIKRNNNFKKFRDNILTGFLLGIGLMAFSQTHNEQVTIIGSFEPSLRPAQKIRFEPETPANILHNLPAEIKGIDRLIHTNSMIGPISPLTILPKEKDFSNSNYLKAGIGSLASPVFMFFHNSKLSRQTAFHAGIEHLSSWIRIKDYAPSDWMKNQFSTGVSHDFSNHSLATELFYKRNHHRYYGFKPDDFPGLSLVNDSIAQQYQHYGLKAKLQSSYRDPLALHHALTLEYGRFTDHYSNFENGIEINANVNKNFDLFRFGGIQTLALDLHSSMYNSGDSSLKTNDFFIGLLPKIELKGSFYQLGAALRFEYLNDSAGNAFLYPKLWGRLLILDQKLEFYADMDGGHQRQSLFNIIQFNPFIHPGASSWWENSAFKFETGIKTGLINNMDIRIGLRFDELKNKGFFVTDTTSLFHHQLATTFDNGSRLQFLSEISYKLSNQWSASLTLQYQSFQLDNIDEAWHEPKLLLNLHLGHQWNDRWYFASVVNYESERYAPTFNAGIQNIHSLKPVVDMNLYARYTLNEQLALFGSLNNLFHQRYERYYNFPVQGIQLFAGISLKF